MAEVQEQYSRRNCLVFFGVPELPGEDTNHLISDICTTQLKMKVSPSDLDRSHRLGVKPDPSTSGSHNPKNRGIIVKFARYDVRAEVYRAKKKLKGSRTFICESLTSERLDVYTQIRKEHDDSVASTWTQDGRIHVLLKSSKDRLVLNSLSDCKSLPFKVK